MAIKMKIKEKVLKELEKEDKGVKYAKQSMRGRVLLNEVEKDRIKIIDLTFAEVGKVIDEKIEKLSKIKFHNSNLEYREELGIRISDLEELKQKLGIK